MAEPLRSPAVVQPAAPPHRHERRLLAYGSLLAAAVVLGTMSPVSRFVMDRGVVYLDLGAARAWSGCLILLASLAVTTRGRGRSRPAPLTWRTFGLAAAFGVVLTSTNTVAAYAVANLPVGIAVVLGYLAPVLVVAWSWVVWRQQPRLSLLIALLLALSGAALLSDLVDVGLGPKAQLGTVGLAVGFATAVGFAIILVLGQRLASEIGAQMSLTVAYSVAAIAWIPATVFLGGPTSLEHGSLIPAVVYVGIVGTAGYALLNLALPYVDVRIAGIVTMLEIVVATWVAYVWLGQLLSPQELIGSALIIAGSALVTALRPARI